MIGSSPVGPRKTSLLARFVLALVLLAAGSARASELPTIGVEVKANPHVGPLVVELVASDKFTSFRTGLADKLIKEISTLDPSGKVSQRWSFVPGNEGDASILLDIGQFETGGDSTTKKLLRLRLRHGGDEYWKAVHEWEDTFRFKALGDGNAVEGQHSVSPQLDLLLTRNNGAALDTLRRKLLDLSAKIEANFGPWTEFEVRMPDIAKPSGEGYARNTLLRSTTKTKQTVQLDRESAVPFVYWWPLLDPDEGIDFSFYRVKGYSQIQAKEAATLVVSRQSQSEHSTPKVEVRCPVEGECCLVASTPGDWVTGNQCEQQDGSLWRLPWLVGAAHAASVRRAVGPEVWAVPTRTQLIERQFATANIRDYRNTGFVEFTIQATDTAGVLKGDAYSLSVTVNGQDVWENGIPPEERLVPFDPENGLAVEFAIENLNLIGGDNGCDVIGVDLSLWQNGKPTGHTFRLVRPYGALRHAYVYPDGKDGIQIDGVRFFWEGNYRPPIGGEREVFLLSRTFDLANEGYHQKVLRAIREARNRFDDLGWTVSASDLGWPTADATSELPLIGQIRPPLHKNSKGLYVYSIAAGLQLETGQIRYTFTAAEADAIGRQLIELALKDPKGREFVLPINKETRKSVPLEQATPENLHLYKLRGPDEKLADSWVCNRSADLISLK